MSEPYRVCVVCTGNICRSPMGEFILRELFEEAGLCQRRPKTDPFPSVEY